VFAKRYAVPFCDQARNEGQFVRRTSERLSIEECKRNKTERLKRKIDGVLNAQRRPLKRTKSSS
jgi:hypothetical protein